MSKYAEDYREKTIKFHPKFAQPIKDNIKTSTIRTNFNGSPGDIMEVYIRDDNMLGNIGKIRIKHVARIRFDEITREKAVTEGYLHEALVKQELLNFYPELEDSSLLYYVTFEYMEDSPKGWTATKQIQGE